MANVFEAKPKKGSVYILSAWVYKYRLSLAQETLLDGKENGIIVVPEMLDSLELKGAIVCLDAMGTQTSIAGQIVNTKAEYVLYLKQNHKHFLLLNRQDDFTGKYKCFAHHILDTEQERVEEHAYITLKVEDIFDEDEYASWPSLSVCGLTP